MISSLPVLQVVIPLLSAIGCALLKDARLVKIISAIVVLISSAIAVVLFFQVYHGGVIKYSIGGWIVPYGIELKVNVFNSMMLVLVGFVAMMSIVYGIYPNTKEINVRTIPSFYSVFLLCFSGFLGILVSNDVFNIYVFLEISSISSYILVAMGNNRNALIAAFDYLVIGTIGATFYLIGVGFLYAITGTLNVGNLFLIVQDKSLTTNRAIQVGLLFIMLGLFIKAALFPFHKWLIQAYNYAPTFISVFFSGVSTKVMIYLIIKVIYDVFKAELVLLTLPFNIVFMSFAALSVISASILAMLSSNMKRIFAYSSVAHLGYIIFAVGLNTYYGLVAAVTYIINHSLVKSALFMVMGSISYNCGSLELKDCTNIWKNMPKIALPFVILCISLIGMPITSGFISKWYVFDAAIKTNFWLGVIVLLIGSGLSVVYVWNIIEATCFKPSDKQVKKLFEVPNVMVLCIWVMAISSIILGLYPVPLMMISNKIAESLLY
ncbi:NADH-Ubiquinone/plastoquinone (complex I), various chains family protein [Ehrlichia chaffeensis str. Heartland]|uniref:NADH dehydrogenase I, N subunit n=1 Tax=Ehrlichia chaffeensis (strain ATCC CRL-10679 / Arkansas) TaxID=205920 RepID=Q2GHS9_EHRCR|nr:proton-conducting transporter membrane subunit [Ehrlichia chaffeensis]ABD44810.1 putative NADH dehydrogenase I, N subunit [Ehrlichia chaffeensis str. Arkansas]AHX04027.1 NADH-Ubiquinone/plastoquinone (complex I), various chains family protein [Ehrlichia chaffeensis str. Heartland]AHX05961.1 NADH-Ubiquinone/plastoquinone (complex I), various chains family protein [Ehrlichia chaffeensis str. Jax]AHX06951.1 NADH-Ubiquinone/plastoquinone (complex I), various chains family protein [Ehrlichia chaf